MIVKGELALTLAQSVQFPLVIPLTVKVNCFAAPFGHSLHVLTIGPCDLAEADDIKLDKLLATGRAAGEPLLLDELESEELDEDGDTEGPGGVGAALDGGTGGKEDDDESKDEAATAELLDRADERVGEEDSDDDFTEGDSELDEVIEGGELLLVTAADDRDGDDVVSDEGTDDGGIALLADAGGEALADGCDDATLFPDDGAKETTDDETGGATDDELTAGDAAGEATEDDGATEGGDGTDGAASELLLGGDELGSDGPELSEEGGKLERRLLEEDETGRLELDDSRLLDSSDDRDDEEDDREDEDDTPQQASDRA